MNDKILTISIAAYNVEKYIRDTLDSLIVPEILSDIEVLVVDDGSTDSTYSIAKEYEDKYPNVFKAIHKDNGGYGSTVNYSIDNAHGKYFKLLDGDDWFDKDGFIKLINVLNKSSCDVVLTQFCKVYEDNKIVAIRFDEKQVGKEIRIGKFNFNAAVPMHAVTIKTDKLKESRVKLPEHMLYTDNIYAAQSFVHVDTIQCDNFVVYNYRQGVDGQSVSDRSLIEHIDESIKIAIDLTMFYADKVSHDMKSRNYIEMNIASTCVNAIVGILKMKPSKKALNMLKTFDKEIKELSNDIYMRMEKLDRKASQVLKFIRTTNYLLYWVFASKV